MDAGEIGFDAFRAVARPAWPPFDMLVEAVYEACGASGTWAAFLEALTAHAPIRGTTLFTLDPRDGAVMPLGAAGFGRDPCQGFVASCWQDVGWMAGLHHASPGTMVDLRESGTQAAGAFVRGPTPARAPAGVLVVVARDDGRLTVWAVDPSPSADAEARALVRMLTPHLVRAWRLRRQLEAGAWARCLNDELYARLRIGAMRVDCEGRIERASRSALALLDEAGLLVPAGARELALRGEARRLWLARIRAACVPCRDEGDDGQALLRLPMRAIGEAPSLCLLVRPMPADAGMAGSPGPFALVFVSRADQTGAVPPAATLAAMYGLTPAEAQVLAGMLAGDSPADCARHRGVTLDTVRTQVRGMLAKTGQRRQIDLVRLVAGAVIPRLGHPSS